LRTIRIAQEIACDVMNEFRVKFKEKGPE